MTAITKKLTRREQERLVRVELILDSAEELFLDKGFTATTMNDIGEAAEFGRATLYHYFPSKEAIYVAILERAMDSLIVDTAKATKQVDDAPEKIDKIRDTLLAFLYQKQNFFHLYFITRAEVLPSLGKDHAKRIEKKTKEFEKIFHDIYLDGADKGVLKPGDPLALGDIFFAQIIGLMLLNRTEQLEPPLTANVNQATRFFLENVVVNDNKSVE